MIETPEHLAEAGREDEQPDQRPHQRRDEALALMQEAQALAPDDAVQADGVLREREAGRAIGGPSLTLMRPRSFGARRLGQRAEGGADVRASPASATTSGTGPCASTRP